ncbi:hypothetical protein HBH64_007740 [Parastagonospora nodorum]|nr:hypothetical protein HBI10_016060 [Parastagonospora nodorum]KAH4025795.1 hypothetical protein HBI13_069990 [Parastagonospora nodorum]KAH4312522.1 hypothetical protein HBI01_005280 [Parastagonospora nodorum]KAH4315996.1 hypothetical protein HBI02_042880 [Parastagonospora nodorum]KAH4332346.1 hypothetical protein HBI00_057330 [Parastagonospora nodorum]
MPTNSIRNIILPPPPVYSDHIPPAYDPNASTQIVDPRIVAADIILIFYVVSALGFLLYGMVWLRRRQRARVVGQSLG